MMFFFFFFAVPVSVLSFIWYLLSRVHYWKTNCVDQTGNADFWYKMCHELQHQVDDLKIKRK